MKKLFLLILIFGFNTPVNAEQYQRHKYTCPESQGECSEGERSAIKLVNDTYWEMLSERIKENKFYKYPWYWVYKKGECKYCLLYTSPSPRDATLSRMPSSA